jgi:hypothetical protein
MDAERQRDHDRRQDDRRGRERRQAQLSHDKVPGWDGEERRTEDRRELERRELERRIRSSQVVDSGETPGV